MEFLSLLQRLEVQAPTGNDQEENLQHPYRKNGKDRTVLERDTVRNVPLEYRVSAHRYRFRVSWESRSNRYDWSVVNLILIG